MSIEADETEVGGRYWYSEAGIHFIVEVMDKTTMPMPRISGTSLNVYLSLRVLAVGASRCDIRPGQRFRVMQSFGSPYGGYCPWHLRTLRALGEQRPFSLPIVEIFKRKGV